MVKRIALLSDNQIVNVSVASGTYTAAHDEIDLTPFENIQIGVDTFIDENQVKHEAIRYGSPGIGWRWDGERFTPPQNEA